jgi:urease accessory protein
MLDPRTDLPAAPVPPATPATPSLQRVRGEGRIVAKLVDGRTRIATLFQEGAAKVRLPHTHDATLEAVLINTAGGLTGGDRLAWTVEAAPGCRLLVTTPASERVYRSLGTDVTLQTRLAVGAGARLDWLPQETILYEAARLDRRFEVDLAPDATLLMLEAVLLGRHAMGESAETARFADNWRVRRGGHLVHAEASRLTANPRERQNLSLLAGARAFATLLYIGADAERRAATVRELAADPLVGSSRIGEKLVVRVLAPSGIALRRTIVPIIALLSERGRVPRLWNF